MSNIDKQALRKAAIAATGGKWVFSRSGVNSNVQAPIELQKGGRALVVLCKLNNAGWSGQIQTENNAKFIAAANPATVLALLDELEAKEEQRANWFQMAQKLGDDLDAAEKRIAEQQRSLDHREFLLLSADQVQREYAEALGCAGDNESILEAIDDMKKRIAELEARAFNPAILDVVAERQRQQSVEGWTPEHDDLHDSGELAGAAACYAHYTNARGWVFPTDPGNYQSADEPNNWPWDPVWWKPTNPRRDLVKAGALILAEIERIDRAAGIGKGE